MLGGVATVAEGKHVGRALDCEELINLYPASDLVDAAGRQELGHLRLVGRHPDAGDHQVGLQFSLAHSQALLLHLVSMCLYLMVEHYMCFLDH